ncbi:nickel pincer cofactor biosynthesis protein LarC [Pseudonocardia parietis]|uniref:Pyridinium-3,5-bisthiocarboxylic acid mononucleotide nickel insertion protein n=1 Tax=Pseudonocardia parietis TaxID=570936 RepID=A0ABS4VV71_9PSEU|nr:nickel pincer cofactor biosynthesis protein LarC [Pseudonocardia parietis]MBP2367815.1 uncharacterized protein (TIGR00299 family) protein [Pseudonocardia parietis]
MTRTAWIDAGNGAAGDMLLAASVDAGASLEAVRAALASLPLTGGDRIDLRIREVRRHGLRAGYAEVRATPSTVHRTPGDVRSLLAGSAAPSDAVRFATSVFDRLARAEAAVHGVDVEQVHFHEVGALDSIADVLGVAVAFGELGLLDARARVVASPVALGSGSVRAAHGRLPVPAPAVLRIVAEAGIPIASHPARFELCTPTGAALIAEIADEWGPLPASTVSAVGVGAGTADPAEHPNTLRLVLGDRREATTGDPAPWRREELLTVETTVDDLDPRRWPDVLESLHDTGALDAWLTPVLMRKGRPGHVLTVLVAPAVLDAVVVRIFEVTSTLGVRVRGVERRSLHRDEIRVDLGSGAVAVKRGLLAGRVVTVQPEYREIRELAERTGLPVDELLDLARTTARAEGTGPRPPGEPGPGAGPGPGDQP